METPAFGRGFIMNKERIHLKINSLKNQLEHVSERLYVPHIEVSEYRELCKKQKKLKKDIDKLMRKCNDEN
jgi:hypothetical protein